MSMMSRVLATAVLAVVSLAWMPGRSMAQATSQPQWESIAPGLYDARGIGCERYALGFDRASGKLFVDCGAGVWSSADQGRTFSRADIETAGPATAAGARSGWSLWVAPDGGRLAAFNSHVAGKPSSGFSADSGKTWKPFTNNWRWGVMGPDGEAALAIGDNDLASMSSDGGKTWTALPSPRGVCGLGILGATTWVVSRTDGRIERSEDGGKTWKEVAAKYACAGPLQVFKGVGYWLARKGDSTGKEYCILTSKDKGATWQQLCAVPSVFSGVPVFGKDEKEIFVATVKGIMATTDAGAHWTLAAAYPEYMPESEYGKLTRAGKPRLNGWEQADRHIAYDFVQGVLYLGAVSWEGPQKYLKLRLKPETVVAGAPPARLEKGRWTDLTAVCNEQVPSANTVHSSTPIVHLRNVAVDRATGNLFVGDGPIGMSADGGKSFKLVNEDKEAGGYFGCGGWGLQTDSRGGRIYSIGSIDHATRAVAYSLDGGKKWEKLATKANGHGIWGVADAESKTMLMYGNEGESHFWGSADWGKTWSPLLKDRAVLGAGIFSDKEWVVSSSAGNRGPYHLGRIERTEDGGKTWTRVADHGCLGPMKVFKGVGYWTTPKDDKHWVVITTKDKGKTWQELGVPFEEDSYVNFGPMIGKDENQLFVMTWWGILETTDAGAHWKMAAPFTGDGPRCEAMNLGGYLVGATLPSVDYDPVHDAFYFANGGNVWLAGSGTIWKFQR